LRLSTAIPHIERFWKRDNPSDWVNDNTLLSGLSLGLQETLLYLSAAKPTLVRSR